MAEQATGYTYVWEFQVLPEAIAEFEKHYGAQGTWVELFRRAHGYIESLLLKDAATPGRYLTVDRWRSEADYLAFREAFSLQYSHLDLECARFTTSERLLGIFSEE